MFNRFFMFMILMSAIIFSGCASQQLRSYETSGFLGSYAGFTPGDKDQPNLVYLNPSRNLGQYNKVLIDHVIVYFNPESENKGIDPVQLNELSQYFHQALVDALKDRYPIVDRPGAGVLRIRTAITDVEPGSPVKGAATSIVPVGMAISAIKKSTTGSNMAVGRASMEIELVDSLSGARLAAAIDRREGGKQVVSGKWSAIEEAFNYWAQKLRVWLDKERAK
jgi:hypothetical protein